MRHHILRHLIWVYTVCSSLFVQILTVHTVIFMASYLLSCRPECPSENGRICSQRCFKEYHNTLRKHAYSNTCILKISPPKNWKFSDKNSDIFHISAQNLDCGYSLELPCQGSSNKYTQPMFLSKNKKNNVYPCKPQFYYIKVGFKGVKII